MSWLHGRNHCAQRLLLAEITDESKPKIPLEAWSIGKTIGIPKVFNFQAAVI